MSSKQGSLRNCLPLHQQIANIQHFLLHFHQVGEGGYYQWKDTGHVYTKKDGKMYTTKKGRKDILDITNKRFVKDNIFLNPSKPVSH